jgi:hypothetical protein
MIRLITFIFLVSGWVFGYFVINGPGEGIWLLAALASLLLYVFLTIYILVKRRS